jgi:DNA-binding response OmpR family regulator
MDLLLTSQNRKIISIDTELELLRLRHAVFESAGFEVYSTQHERDALANMESSDCGVLLLCYSLDYEVRRRLADNFRNLSPTSRIVAITNKQVEHADFADTFVYGIDGPEALIDALRESR